MAKKSVAYEETNSFINYETGDIVSKSQTKVMKFDVSSDRFFKVFVDNTGMLYGLRKITSFKVLFALLNMCTNRENFICLAFGMRTKVSNFLNIHLNVFKTALDELVSKDLLLKTDSKDFFMLNPYIFGQGSFIDVEKLRQSIEIEYDFKSGEVKKVISADSITHFGMNIFKNSDKYDVVDVVKEYNDKDSKLAVLVREKDESIIECDTVDTQEFIQTNETIQSVEEELNIKEQNTIVDTNETQHIIHTTSVDNTIVNNPMLLEFELLKEKNRAKELENESKKLELAILKEQNKKKKLDIVYSDEDF